MGVSDFQKLDRITLSGDINLRTSPYFRGNYNKIGNIPSGSRAKVIAYDTNKRFGVGVKVEILSGPKKGKTGWLYYPRNKKKRTFDFQDIYGKKVEVPNDFFGFFKQAKKYRKKIEQATHIKTKANTPVALEYNREKGKFYWKKIAQGTYEIDVANYSGGPFVPVKVREKTPSGEVVEKRIFLKRDYSELLNSLSGVSDSGSLDRNDCGPQDSHAPLTSIRPRARPQRTFDTDKMDFVNGCQILTKKPLQDSDEMSLSVCLDNLLKRAREGNMTEGGALKRAPLFKSLFTRFNPLEKRFLAMAITAQGEAGILSHKGPQEMMSIMKVVDNRLKVAQKQENDPRLNELDIVLQDMQFSMYNANKNDWRNAFKRKPGHKYYKRALRAFISYQTAKIQPYPKSEDITFFHTNYVQPPWSRGANETQWTFNGNIPNGAMLRYQGVRKHIKHKFFTNTEVERVTGKNGYTFAYNPWHTL